MCLEPKSLWKDFNFFELGYNFVRNKDSNGRDWGELGRRDSAETDFIEDCDNESYQKLKYSKSKSKSLNFEDEYDSDIIRDG